MKTCEYCGAHLDAGEKCDCREAVAEVLEDQKTADTAEMLKRLPEEVKRKIGWMIQGAALVTDGKAG